VAEGDPSPARPAFYAMAPGGWRDWWTLLHPPYTLWHLSYVVVGASLAPEVQMRWLGETLLAFFLAMGLAAHALDELHGRPLGTRIPSAALVVVAYNLELFGGAFHSDLWFALAWGAFPVLTAAFAQTADVRVAALVAAAACALLSAAQRVLSTPVRDLRRRAVEVRGSIVDHEGGTRPIDAGTLRDAPERALRLLSVAVPLLALAMLASKEL